MPIASATWNHEPLEISLAEMTNRATETSGYARTGSPDILACLLSSSGELIRRHKRAVFTVEREVPHLLRLYAAKDRRRMA